MSKPAASKSNLKGLKNAEEIALLAKRRDTLVDAAEGLIEEKNSIEKHKEEEKSKTLKQRLVELKNSIYESETNKFLERDGLQWFKLALFYFIFYIILSGWFIGLLTIFAGTLDYNVPRYYDQTSVMNYASPVNPGLGFRPQYNPENSFIKINFSEPKNWKEEYVHTLSSFLEKYENLKAEEVNMNPEKLERVVSFDYNKLIQNTGCSRENQFGLASGKPCIALKMNKIFGWRPQPHAEPPEELNVQVPAGVKTGNKTNYLDRFIYVQCKGRDAFDTDNIGKLNYYSQYPSNEIGGISAKFYPYKKQKNYLSPLIFVQFENIARNVLINVECKLYARNIDNQDRRNMRGMTKMEFYISN